MFNIKSFQPVFAIVNDSEICVACRAPILDKCITCTLGDNTGTCTSTKDSEGKCVHVHCLATGK